MIKGFRDIDGKGWRLIHPTQSDRPLKDFQEYIFLKILLI